MQGNIVKCLVTNKKLDEDKSLRFVLSPENVVTPDIYNKLTGEACYIDCHSDILIKACSKSIFKLFWGDSIVIPNNLLQLTIKLLENQCLQTISLAKRSGNLVTGFDKVYQKVVSDSAVLLIQAKDASDDGKRKIRNKAEKIPVYDCFLRSMLAQSLGKDDVVHIAITNNKWKAQLIKVFFRYENLVSSSDY